MIPGATPIKVFFPHAWGVQGMAYEDNYIQTTTYTRRLADVLHTHTHTHTTTHVAHKHTNTHAHLHMLFLRGVENT